MPSEWRWNLGGRQTYLRERSDALGQHHATGGSERRAGAPSTVPFEQRLDDLSADLNRLVELTQLREELDLHLHHELVRRQVRAQLVALGVVGTARRNRAAGESLAPPPVTDDYWLAPAARALPRLLAGGHGSPDDDPEVAEARLLDPARTDRFLLLALVLAGRGGPAVALLGSALGGNGDGRVTVGQRALWRAAAAGALGPAGRHGVVAWLQSRAGGVDRARTADRVERWHHRLVERVATFADLPDAVRDSYRPQLNPLQDAMAAIWALDGLADRYRQAMVKLAGPETAGIAQVDGSVTAEELQWALISLVDEGTADEAPLLRRMEHLRRELHGRSGAAGAGRWELEPTDPDRVVGEVDDLLLSDALGRSRDGDGGLGREEVADGLAAVAWRAAEPILAELCRQLRRTALGLPDVDPTVELEIARTSLVVTGAPFRAGEDEAFAREAAERQYPTPGGVLSKLREDLSDERERYRQHCLERIRSAQVALAKVADHLTGARAARARALAELAPLGITRDLVD